MKIVMSIRNPLRDIHILPAIVMGISIRINGPRHFKRSARMATTTGYRRVSVVNSQFLYECITTHKSRQQLEHMAVQYAIALPHPKSPSLL